eukprot:TRINITY_DN5227_c0_g1_i1.p1 TRINITY_DN5227_c0_g1~~TRINITY_DN5227_c0_g1_i1.p1  ORF type:complete len:615 (+),score=179.84 TRINITY_DN5227_c0_g1_i1:92-1846(+)
MAASQRAVSMRIRQQAEPDHPFGDAEGSSGRRRGVKPRASSWPAALGALALFCFLVGTYLMVTEPVPADGGAAADPQPGGGADAGSGVGAQMTVDDLRGGLREARDALGDAHKTISRLRAEVRQLRGDRSEGSDDGGGGSDAQEPEPAHNSKLPPYAFVNVISAEVYIDGAIVMALSFRDKSPMVKAGTCALVCLVPRGVISAEGRTRLQRAGWKVVEVDSLAAHVPRAHWKDSFDKLHLFGLTQFRRIVFCDSDMLVLENPEKLLHTRLPNSTWVGAIGNNPIKKKPYFQTGMLVIQPTREVYNSIMREFLSQSLPKNKGGEYNSLNGRDGVLMRSFFGPRYVQIDNKYSKHVSPWEPLDGIVMTHFRGSFKPWNDPEMFFEEDPRRGSKEFGPGYRLWWEYYDAFHRDETSAWSDGDRWGIDGKSNPREKVWMLRHTKQEYMMYRRPVMLERRNKTRSGLSLAVGGAGESCDARCSKAGMTCDEAALNYTLLTDCKLLDRAFTVGGAGGCNTCEFAVHRGGHPCGEAPLQADGRCLLPYWHDSRIQPNCSSKHADARRLCPCLADDAGEEEGWDGRPVPVVH